MLMLRVVVRSLLCVVGLASIAEAQAQAQARYSFDITLGGTRASSRAYSGDGDGYGGNILLARSNVEPGASGLVLGLALSADGGAARDLLCTPDGAGGCVPRHRDIASLTALAGWRSTNGLLRIFAGPALAQEKQAALGVAGRVDLAVPTQTRVAITANVRGLLLPSVRGEMYQIVSFGVGLRFQQRR